MTPLQREILPAQKLAAVLRAPRGKERRRRLHGVVERNRCDVTRVTERKDRPFTMTRIPQTVTGSPARASAGRLAPSPMRSKLGSRIRVNAALTHIPPMITAASPR